MGKSFGAKKPHKQFGGKKGLAYMTAMLEAIQKGQKKAAKSKKRKKRAYDSGSDSDSEWEIGCGDTGLGRDKRLKLDKPSSDLFLSTTATRPIKVADTAPSDLNDTRDVRDETKN